MPSIGLGNGGVMQPYTLIVVLAAVPVLLDTLILLVTHIRGGVHYERAWCAPTVRAPRARAAARLLRTSTAVRGLAFGGWRSV